MKQAACLAGQIDARLLHEAEGTAIVIESAAADLQTHVGKSDIAGILEGLGGGLAAVAAVPPAVQGLLATLQFFRACAVEGVAQGNGAGIQPRRQSKQLKGRAGLIAVGNTAVAPLLQTGGRHRAVVGTEGLFPFLRVLRVFHGGLILGLQFHFHVIVVNGQIAVGVIAPQGSHGKDIAGLGVHDDAEGPVLHIVAVNSVTHLLFQSFLHGQVDGQHQAVPVGSLVIGLIGIEHFGFVVALGGDDRSGSSLQNAVIVGLQALGAFVLRVGEAQKL